jgi:hypothetical protein
MKTNMLKTSLLVLCAVTALAITGCKSAPHGKSVAWNLSITKKTTASIQVDVIGVASQNEETFLQGLSREEYWKPDSQIRKDADKLGNKLTKSLQQDQPWLISRDDPQWAKWLDRGVYELFVVARLPEASGDWKVPLTLDKKAWVAKDKTLEVVVVDSGISVQTKSRN